MKRILFVDDEAEILDALRASLRRQRNEWDMTFALGSTAALEQLHSSPFDVIISDMRMPGMDGAALLACVKAEFPGMVRIVLSGHAERDAVLRALTVSHQFLSKPCVGAELRSVIDRAFGLQDLLGNASLRNVVGGVVNLPSLPAVYFELTQAMGDPNTDCDDVAAIVGRDAAMAAKILQLVNSSYFALARPSSSIEQAVVYLGLDLVRTLALTAHVFSAMEHAPAVPGFSPELVQERALLCARIARQIPTDVGAQEEAFTAGLLQDIGKLILAMAVPDQFAEILAKARKEDVPVHLVEQEVLGVTHAEVGAYLLGLWGLPLPVVEAVAYHHDPARVVPRGLDALAAVHIANAIVSEGAPHLRENATSPALDPAYLATLGVPIDLQKWTRLLPSAPREPKKKT